MSQTELFESLSKDKIKSLTYEEQSEFISIQQDIIRQLQSINKKLIKNSDQSEQTILLNEVYLLLKNKMYGFSSEKSKKDKKNPKDRKDRRKRVLLPSERYPNIPIKEQEIDFLEPPSCQCCGSEMNKSGMTEDSEHLTVTPAKYMVIRQKRHKYRCYCCHGDLKTTPVPPRITPGGSYSDDMIIDASMSKFCDLIPMERYSAIASRAGVKGLPPHSLIESSHQLAKFILPAYKKIKEEVQSAKELRADETPHRLLQLKKKGYLWGFSSSKACYFEIHSTRAGSVAKDFLTNSQCLYLMSDAYSGYSKAVREANEERKELGKNTITNIYCNSHCRRKFKDAEKVGNDESDFFIKCYKKIYALNSKSPTEKFPLKKIKHWQKLYFQLMKRRALDLELCFSRRSAIGIAINYFLKYYDNLTFFVDKNLSIDNNAQERLLRNPVIGRKTWFGTQSPRGAKTASVLFTLVESCKLNNINPREYFKKLVSEIHSGKEIITPAEYSAQ
jgi:transposase